jgi:hypothetical protein
MLAAVGVHRIRVERWLDDAPYPRAEVVEWHDQPPEGDRDGWDEVATLLRRAAALQRELGEPAAPLDLELARDPVVAGYQSVAVAPLGPADRQRLLAAPTLDARRSLLRDLLVGQIDVLQARLSGG